MATTTAVTIAAVATIVVADTTAVADTMTTMMTGAAIDAGIAVITATIVEEEGGVVPAMADGAAATGAKPIDPSGQAWT